MKIALIGATGNAGSRILAELVSRGHAVTAIARNADKVAAGGGVTPKSADVGRPDELAAVLAGHDAVVSSIHFLQFDPKTLVGAVRAAGVKRYLVVGGAGSLEVAPGVKLIDTPNFPAEYKDEAAAGGVCLDVLRGVEDLDWTFLSPAPVFVPGERTGTFRLGADALLPGAMTVSYEDFAVALVDEIEKPAHIRERFSIAY